MARLEREKPGALSDATGPNLTTQPHSPRITLSPKSRPLPTFFFDRDANSVERFRQQSAVLA